MSTVIAKAEERAHGLYTEKFNIPEWAVMYLTYGNDETLSKEERAMVDTWLEEAAFQGGDMYSCSKEGSFSHFPEFGLPCVVYECIFVRCANKEG